MLTSARQHTHAHAPKLLAKLLSRRTLVLLALALVLAAWRHGTFDNFLWRVNLNTHECVQNGFGATFCGADARRYEERVRSLGVEFP